MTPALPQAAYVPAPAALPPTGLPGMDEKFSRLVTVPVVPTLNGEHQPSPSASRECTWHILDNGPQLQAAGLEAVGTILCVHGNPTWSFLWRKLVSAATEQAASGGPVWRVIAVDQLEMGFSERTGTPHKLADRVSELAALTSHLEVNGPVVTLGHDWGGVVSLGWAVDHPDQIVGITVLNTAVHQPEDEPIPAPLRLALSRGILGSGTVTTGAFLETTLSLAHPRLSAAVKAAYRAPYRRAVRRGGIGAFVADIPVDDSHQSWVELERISRGVADLGKTGVPALFLWGPQDPIFSDRYLRDLIERIPHADVHRFEGAGHLVAEDVDYAAGVLQWLGTKFGSGQASPDSAPMDKQNTGNENSGKRTRVTPMWHQLDLHRDSSETALVEMAPGRGREPRVVSWQLLSRRVEEMAAGLHTVGVRRGDRVSLLVQPGADLTAVLYACLRIGAVVVVADAGLGLRGLTRAVRGAGPQHVIGQLPGLTAARALGWPGQRISTEPLSRPTAKALGVAYSLHQIVDLGANRFLPEAPGPADPAAILFTSGSTGPAKGVAYTHAQLCAMRDALSAHYRIGPGTGLVAGFAPFALLGPALGARSVTPDMDVTSPRTLTARAVAASVAAADATTVFLSPAAIANVVATASDLTATDHDVLTSVRLFLSAGAPVSEELLTAVNEMMPNAAAHTPYGMTEGLLITDISLPEIRRARKDSAGSNDLRVNPGGVCVGVPAPSAEVKISALNAAGVADGVPEVTPGRTGEILVRAGHVKDHYDRLWLTEQRSRTVAAQNSMGRDWHRTGDVGHLDNAGRLWIEGRLSHVVTTPTGVVTPVGIEQRIEGTPQVSRAALVGVGPHGTQQLVAVVELHAAQRRVTLADTELTTHLRQAVGLDLAAVLIVPDLPTDIRHNSKIDRTHLAHWAQRMLSGARMSRP